MKGLAGKRIVVGVSGSIAAYKVAGWVSALSKEEALVSVVMTDGAQKFITPLTFSALTGEATYTAMFDDNLDSALSHIELGQMADIFLIAPATAQTIARLAHGMADDLLSAAVLATKAKVIVCPAMNSQMFLNQATQDNLATLRKRGFLVIDPDSGLMACKDDGPGRLPEWAKVEEVVRRELGNKDLLGQKVLITAGPTREHIDPARFISNRSSGKMGYALAKAAWRRGAEVMVVSGPVQLPHLYHIPVKRVESTLEMQAAVEESYTDATIIIKSAAVSDFRPALCHKHKVKKEEGETCIELERNPDILYELGQKKGDRFLVGFAAETQNLLQEATKKLAKKNLDLIVVNQINAEDSGFEADTNKVAILDGAEVKELPLCSKLETADHILDSIAEKMQLAKYEH